MLASAVFESFVMMRPAPQQRLSTLMIEDSNCNFDDRGQSPLMIGDSPLWMMIGDSPLWMMIGDSPLWMMIGDSPLLMIGDSPLWV